jgi:flagellar biosynthesis GTPase FlhF
MGSSSSKNYNEHHESRQPRSRGVLAGISKMIFGSEPTTYNENQYVPKSSFSNSHKIYSNVYQNNYSRTKENYSRTNQNYSQSTYDIDYPANNNTKKTVSYQSKPKRIQNSYTQKTIKKPINRTITKSVNRTMTKLTNKPRTKPIKKTGSTKMEERITLYSSKMIKHINKELRADIKQINEDAQFNQTINWLPNIALKSQMNNKYFNDRPHLSPKRRKNGSDMNKNYEIGWTRLKSVQVFKGKKPDTLSIVLFKLDASNQVQVEYERDVDVVEYSGDVVTFRLGSNFPRKSDANLNKKWMVRESYTLPIMRQERGEGNVKLFEGTCSEIQDIVKCKKLAKKNTTFFDRKGYEIFVGGQKFLDGLNVGQRRAIGSVFANKVSLIQGPPGTGKTTTISRLAICLSNYLKYNQKDQTIHKILITAGSNQAVNNLTESLIKTMEKMNLSPKKKVARIMSMKAYQEGNFKNSPLKPFIVTEAFKYQHKLIEAEFICCTLMTAAVLEKKFRRFPKFNFSIVDEASQTQEAETLGALKLATEKLILVGDQKQLGPVIKDQSNIQDSYKSLFETMIDYGHECSVLTTQYRMHPSIAKSSSDLFYNGIVKSGVQASQRQGHMKIKGVFPKGKPQVFFDICQYEEHFGKSYINRGEINKVVEVVKKLASHGGSIGVIATYSAQVVQIKKRLEEIFVSSLMKRIKVATVDSFQGAEVDFVVVSCVRSNSKNRIGFLRDERRMNVAITRPKHGLVIIGNSVTLGCHSYWRKLIKKYKTQGCFVGRSRRRC